MQIFRRDGVESCSDWVGALEPLKEPRAKKVEERRWEGS